MGEDRRREPRIDRRDFLKTSLKAGGAIAVVGGAAALLYGRKKHEVVTSAAGVLDYAVGDDERYPQLVRVADDNPGRAVDRALEALGGIGRFVRPGERVVVKPNIGWERTPEQAANTNPQLVGRVAALCLEAGASEVIVTDSSCSDLDRAYALSGIGAAATRAGARVVMPQDSDFREMDLGGEALRRWPLLRPVLDADRVINLPIVKHHGLSGVTAAVKNWFGVLGGTRSLLHQDIHQSLFELAQLLRPTLTIVDGIRVLVRNGPQGGRMADVERRDVVIAGTDQVACDALAVTLLGRAPREFRYLQMANGVVGQLDISRVRFVEL